MSQSLARRLLERTDLARDLVEAAQRTDPRPCWMLELVARVPKALGAIEEELDQMGPPAASGVAPDWTGLALVPPGWCGTWLAAPLGGDWGGSVVIGAVDPSAIGLAEQIHFLFGREALLVRVRLSSLLALLPRLQGTVGVAQAELLGTSRSTEPREGNPPRDGRGRARFGGGTQPGIPAPALQRASVESASGDTSPGMPAPVPARTQPGVASPPADGTHGAGQPTIRSPGGLPRPMVSVPSEDDSPEGPPILLVRRLRRSQVPAEELAVKVPPPPRSLADGRHEATSVQPVPTAPIPAASSAVTEASAEVDGADFEAPRSLPAEPNSLDGEMVTAAAASPPAPAEPPADVLCTSAREVVEGHPPPSPLEYVADADSPKELTERVLAALEPWCRVAMVFRVRARDYQLMEARGCRVRELSISAELPSVIATAVKVGGYSGGLPGGPAHVSLASLLDMHSDREELVVGVVRVAGRPTLALLAVGAAGTDSARHVETIASIAGDTLTALLRKRKHDG